MAQTVNVNFKLDSEVKKKMENACNDMGLSLSAAFTIFAKKVARERRIPFMITADPFYEPHNQCHLEQIHQDIITGKAHFTEHELLEAE